MKTRGSVRVFNRYLVFCEIAFFNNYIIIHYLQLRRNSLTTNYNNSIIFRLLGVNYILFIFVCVLHMLD